MILNYTNHITVLFSRGLSGIKRIIDKFDLYEKIWIIAGSVIVIIALGAALSAIHTGFHGEISKIKYEVIASYTGKCPIKEEVNQAFANDGIISKIEYERIRSKCDDHIETVHKNKVRDELKKIITSTGDI